jgi:rhamnose transport system ATP-binding protein
MSGPVLRLEKVVKKFGGTRALVAATLELHQGSICALIGENGAGKSTLVKILTGVYRPDGGSLYIDGTATTIQSPEHARQLGISVIHQEAAVFDELSVAENIFVTARPRRRGLIDWRGMQREAVRLLTRLGCAVSPAAPMRTLSVAQKHLIQVARALSHAAHIVIMDEPTSALSQPEASALLDIATELRNEGRSVLFISHKFEEVFAICDRYTVFRDGTTVAQGYLSDTSLDALVKHMVGRPVAQLYPRAARAPGAEVMRVERLTRAEEYSDISFNLRRGEILGVYGLIGAGRSELTQSLFGVTQADSGHIVLDQRTIKPLHPAEAIAHQLARVPEDRQRQGAILDFSIEQNLTLPSLQKFSRHGWLTAAAAAAATAEWIKRLQVKCSGIGQPLSQLSGGNQQKLVLAKWLLTGPRVLIVEEPTKGIDIGAKAAVHELFNDLAGRGMAIILVSSDLPEILGLSDRVMIMRRGRLVALRERAELDSVQLLRLASAA